MNLSVTDFEAPNAWPQINAFIRETYGDNHIMAQRELFDRYFHDSEACQYNIFAGRVGGELVALLGYVPSEFSWGCQGVISGVWLSMWMVKPGFRTGIGSLLMRRALEKFAIVAGQGANSTNLEIARRMGFAILDSVPRWVLGYDRELMRFIGVTEDLLTKMPFRSQGAHRGSFAGETGGVMTVVGEIGEDLFRPDWAEYSMLAYSSCRSREFLNRRYATYPFFNYQTLFCGPPDRAAVCVYRLEQTRGVEREILVGRILELFFPDGKEGQKRGLAVLASALSAFDRSGVAFCDFFCTSSKIKDVMHILGFRDMKSEKLPNLLNPINFARLHQNIEIKIKNCSDMPEWGDLYVTKVDGDQDRPNSVLDIMR